MSLATAAVLSAFLAVKNVGSTAIDSVVENRQSGPYTSLSDPCARVDLRLVNRKVVESLIKCGAWIVFKSLPRADDGHFGPGAGGGREKPEGKGLGQVSFFDRTNESGFQQETEISPI